MKPLRCVIAVTFLLAEGTGSVTAAPTVFVPKVNLQYGESEDVRAHLHLQALQKAVYLAVGEKDILDAVIAKDKSLPRPEFKRAWEIINDSQGYVPFVRELQEIPR